MARDRRAETFMSQVERDFPIGHPKAADTVIGSPEHINWLREHEFYENKRDFPPGHPKAVDTPGNINHIPWQAGVDPYNPHVEEFTGLQPAAAAAVARWNADEAAGAHESPVLEPIDANVANDALAAERKRLKVDVLTAEQHAAVIEKLQQGQ
jgi:hypothetical protein